MDIEDAPSRGRGETHHGCGRLGYVDASLPLAGKDGEEEGQPGSGIRGKSAAGHARTIADFTRPVVDAARTRA
jgi:hypothetical protein